MPHAGHIARARKTTSNAMRKSCQGLNANSSSCGLASFVSARRAASRSRSRIRTRPAIPPAKSATSPANSPVSMPRPTIWGSGINGRTSPPSMSDPVNRAAHRIAPTRYKNPTANATSAGTTATTASKRSPLPRNSPSFAWTFVAGARSDMCLAGGAFVRPKPEATEHAQQHVRMRDGQCRSGATERSRRLDGSYAPIVSASLVVASCHSAKVKFRQLRPRDFAPRLTLRTTGLSTCVGKFGGRS